MSSVNKIPGQGKADNLDYCLTNLIAIDISDVNRTQLKKVSEENTQLLINRIFSLPYVSSEEGVLVELQNTPNIIFPRHRPIPTVKPKTRWQKFAESKDINKRKRSRLVWDEIQKDWVPRWGNKSAKRNIDLHQPVIEVKRGDDSYADPFEKKSAEKQLVKSKQRLRELRNMVESNGKNLPIGVLDLNKKQKRSKIQIKEVMKRAQISTASYGRFDELAKGEKPTKSITKKKVHPKPLMQERNEFKKTAEIILKKVCC